MAPNAAEAEKIGKYVFNSMEIKPSPDGHNYEGRFLFINKDALPVTYSGHREPVAGKFESNFVRFQILKDEKWKEIDRFLCGTGARDFELAPEKEYQLFTGLDQFKEQDTPLTGRIGLGEFWSESFVLDWKKDRSAGRFAQARTENFAQVRTRLAKAGFKEELLAGDDFCTRLLRSLMKETTAKDMATSFPPFVGKLDAVPWIDLNGTIFIASQSDEVRSGKTEYTVVLSIDPQSFSHDWFRSATKHMKIYGWGDGFQMRLMEDFNESPCRLDVIYSPFENLKRPSEEDAKKLFRRILGNLDGWLR